MTLLRREGDFVLIGEPLPSFEVVGGRAPRVLANDGGTVVLRHKDGSSFETALPYGCLRWAHRLSVAGKEAIRNAA